MHPSARVERGECGSGDKVASAGVFPGGNALQYPNDALLQYCALFPAVRMTVNGWRRRRFPYSVNLNGRSSCEEWVNMWHCPISYRQLEEMMEERGVKVDHCSLGPCVRSDPGAGRERGVVLRIVITCAASVPP